MKRAQVIHKLLWYLAYGYDEPSEETDQDAFYPDKESGVEIHDVMPINSNPTEQGDSRENVISIRLDQAESAEQVNVNSAIIKFIFTCHKAN